MPGITGIINPKVTDSNKAELLKMIDSLHHESFYSKGRYVNESLGLYVGWSCIKGSFSDPLPTWSDSKKIALFFYGENFVLGSEKRGTDAGWNRNAKDILRLYEEKDLGFLDCLNGCFHGLLADLEQSKIILFNDRLGFQRLYYHENGEAFYFSSEAKSILAARKELRAFNSQSLGEYFICGCPLENRTLFRGISTLECGTAYTFSQARLQKKESYFVPGKWENLELFNNDDICHRIRRVVPGVMNRYVSREPRIGISLTGGLDTRLIMAYIDNQRSEIPCYTFGGMHRESYDVKIAREVAALCGHSHEVISLNKDFLCEFPSLAEKAVHISDGALSAEGAYEIYFNRIARQIAPVRVTGNYGSELLRNHTVFSWSYPRKELINPDFSGYVDLAVKTFKKISACHDLSFRIFKQAPWLGYGRTAVEQSQVIVRNPFLDYDLLELMYRVPKGQRVGSDLELRLIHEASPRLLEIPTDRAERSRYMRRLPFWTHAWVTFILKADNCYKSYMPQWLEQIHYWLGPFQPERWIIGRNRFYYYRIWYRRELASYIRDIVLDPRTLKRAYLNGGFIEKMVNRHIKGDRNYTHDIEKVLTLELIQKLFF